MIKKLVCAVLMALLPTVPAEAGGVQIGLLKCRIDGGPAYLIGSSKGVSCEFRASHGGSVEAYSGVISKLGVDLGQTLGGKLVWAVLAAGGDYHAGGLAGKYYGVNEEVTVGLGLGVTTLVGGFDRSVSLQPVSIQAQSGFNVSLAMVGLELTSSEKHKRLSRHLKGR